MEISQETLKWTIEEVEQMLKGEYRHFKYLNKEQGKELLNFLESLKE